jgi:hypothetical protein
MPTRHGLSWAGDAPRPICVLIGSTNKQTHGTKKIKKQQQKQTKVVAL